MKTKFQVAKVAFAAVLGSLIWAGCASTAPTTANGRPVVDNTINLQDTGPDTHPEWRTGIYNYNDEGNWDTQAIE